MLKFNYVQMFSKVPFVTVMVKSFSESTAVNSKQPDRIYELVPSSPPLHSVKIIYPSFEMKL